ncbi:ATP synthase protein I [Sphingobium cloacae]|uniref:ATP synthase protein I n=2 Tax=Sphingobium cloacae TaxID=120107 RepID=A0A1E1F4A9_9SPHN|nr:ATP synthase protein I [Sphingobium cloacae]
MARFGVSMTATLLLAFMVSACDAARNGHETANAATSAVAQQLSQSDEKLEQTGDCVAPPATGGTIASDDPRWRSFDFWVDRMRRGVARPADAGDRSGIGHFCGTWSVAIFQPNVEKPAGVIGLRVAPDGSYVAIVRDGVADDDYAFHIDRGQISASGAGLRFASGQGWNDEGQWLPVTGGGMVAMMQQKILWFRPIGPNARRQVDAMANAANGTGKDAASNVALAMAIGKAWSPDAELRALELRPHDGDFASPVVVPSFYSRTKNVTMVMLFDAAAGQLPTGKTYAGDVTGTTKAIPADAMALPSLAGGGREDGPAVLRWWGDGDAAHLWWVFKRPMAGNRRGDVCYDVAQSGVRDCRALFGDDVADYEQRAAAVRRNRQTAPRRGSDSAPFVLRPPCSATWLEPGDVCNDFGTDKIVR